MNHNPHVLYPPPKHLAWSIWGLGALLYLIGFFQRVAPAVMTDKLMLDFGIGATGVGHMSAFYFYSYVAMQIPTGMLVDHWGPRRLLTAGAFTAGLGTLLFAVATHTPIANLGRFLIGGSVAVAFVSLLKLGAHWFSPRHYAAMTGYTLMVGIIGAVAAGMPLRVMVDLWNWRAVMLIAAIITIVNGLITWLVVRDDPQSGGYRSYAPPAEPSGSPGGGGLFAELTDVFRYRNIWLLLIIPGGLVGCCLTFAGLWGVPYLVAVYGLAPATASAINSVILVAMAIGGPLLGKISDRTGRRKPLLTLCCMIVTAGWFTALMIPGLPFTVAVVVLVITGFASGAVILSFALVKETVPGRLAGTASGAVNTGVMLGPMVLQPAVGWILDRNWAGQLVDGSRVFSVQAYRTGFTLMLAWMVLSLLLVFFTQEADQRK